jgi:hypothetical protein
MLIIVAARAGNCTWHTENMIVLNTAYGLWRKQIGGEQFFKFFEISYLYETRTVFQFFSHSRYGWRIRTVLSSFGWRIRAYLFCVSLRTAVCRVTHSTLLIWLAYSDCTLLIWLAEADSFEVKYRISTVNHSKKSRDPGFDRISPKLCQYELLGHIQFFF